MKVAVFFALVATAVAAPAFVVNPSPLISTFNAPLTYSAPSVVAIGSQKPNFVVEPEHGVVPTTYTAFKGAYSSSPAGTFIAGNTPFVSSGAIPTTYTAGFPGSFATGSVIPTTYTAGFGGNFASGSVIPTTYTAGFGGNFAAGSFPTTYSAGGFIPTTYTAGFAGKVAKTHQQNEGGSLTTF